MNTISFVNGPADGRQLEVPVLALAPTLWVRTHVDELILYLGPRAGTVEYRRGEDDENTEYVAVDTA